MRILFAQVAWTAPVLAAFTKLRQELGRAARRCISVELHSKVVWRVQAWLVGTVHGQHPPCCFQPLVLGLLWPLKVFCLWENFIGARKWRTCVMCSSTCTCTSMWVGRCQRRAARCLRLAAMRQSAPLACHCGPLNLGVTGLMVAWQGFGMGNRFPRQAQGRQESVTCKVLLVSTCMMCL